MTIMTRAITAFAVLTAAAIPVGALTVKNTSSNDVSIAVDNGANEGFIRSRRAARSTSRKTAPPTAP